MENSDFVAFIFFCDPCGCVCGVCKWIAFIPPWTLRLSLFAYLIHLENPFAIGFIIVKFNAVHETNPFDSKCENQKGKKQQQIFSCKIQMKIGWIRSFAICSATINWHEYEERGKNTISHCY